MFTRTMCSSSIRRHCWLEDGIVSIGLLLMKTFTKYADRRLYDKERKCFTNLKALISYIRAGETVEVVCSKTGKDCTQSVLLSAFLSLPESINTLNEHMLYRFIRSTGPGVYNLSLIHI